jgi:protein-disulfide isomerase
MKPFKVIIAIVALIAFFFLLARLSYIKKEKQIENTDLTQATVLEIKADDWATGSPDAKATLVEYLDFECEACKAFYPLTIQLKEEYKDSLRFVVRYLPLPGHKNSRTAAYAAEAAGKQGKFWEMYHILFTKQSEWGEQRATNQAQFEKYAVEAGVDIDQWKKDVASSEVMKRVDENYTEAMSLNLQGTPSFFLNGKKIELPNGYDAFKKLIEDSLIN